ncbi:hypothetical protein [Actinacidiphila glaucinigra]|uniref:hypothetical protein n=1 Tax=Actinacidiphila glaucinigra TaxID=235986 RepID=UPI003D927724
MPGRRPVPDELRTLLTDPGTDQLAELFQQVPWLPPVDYYGNALRSCIDEMLTPGTPGKDAYSPWG